MIQTQPIHRLSFLYFVKKEHTDKLEQKPEKNEFKTIVLALVHVQTRVILGTNPSNKDRLT